MIGRCRKFGGNFSCVSFCSLDLYIEQYVNERGSVFITAWWQNGAIAKMRDCLLYGSNLNQKYSDANNTDLAAAVYENRRRAAAEIL